MFNKIEDWFKEQQKKFQQWKEEQERLQRQWKKKADKVIPPSLKKLVEMYPLIKNMEFYNPILINPEEESEFSRDLEAKNYIKKIHMELIENLHNNAINSRAGKNGRKIRLATPKELKEYNDKKTENLKIWKIENDLNIISSYAGIPEVKAYHLKIMGAKLGSKIYLSSSNVIDPYFPELVDIGDNVILGMGASIFCHEFIDGSLYVGKVKIGKNCLVGFGSIVLPGTQMGDNSILTPGFLTSDLKERTMAKGLDGSNRIDKEQSMQLPKRRVERLNFTLHDYMSKLIFPKGKRLNTAFNNMYIEWQKSALVSPSFRIKLLNKAGVNIGKNVKIEDNVHFDTFYPEKISIKDGVIIKSGALIITHEGTVSNFRSGTVEIGENVIIESGAKILPGVKIGKNSKIFPFALVDCDVPPDSEFKS
jgi:acetyltransferase-like isoleucine patch superfamily enzyme